MAVSAVYARITQLARFDGKASLDAPVIYSNISATTAGFHLEPGHYAIDIMGTSFGTVTLQKLAADGSTYVDLKHYFNNAGTEADLVIGAWAANGSKNLYLGAGTYKLTLA